MAMCRDRPFSSVVPIGLIISSQPRRRVVKISRKSESRQEMPDQSIGRSGPAESEVARRSKNRRGTRTGWVLERVVGVDRVAVAGADQAIQRRRGNGVTQEHDVAIEEQGDDAAGVRAEGLVVGPA